MLHEQLYISSEENKIPFLIIKRKTEHTTPWAKYFLRLTYTSPQTENPTKWIYIEEHEITCSGMIMSPCSAKLMHQYSYWFSSTCLSKQLFLSGCSRDTNTEMLKEWAMYQRTFLELDVRFLVINRTAYSLQQN